MAPVLPNLPKQLVEDVCLEEVLSDALENDETLTGLHLQGERWVAEPMKKVCFSKAVLTGCRFLECHMERAEFVDVRFDRCDFSSSFLQGSYFSRCHFVGCKGIGTQMQDAVFRNVRMEDCNFELAAFDDALFYQSQFSNSRFAQAWFLQCSIKGLLLEKCDFTKASFFHTALKGVDFTQCELQGISVAIEDLKGIIVNQYQAAQLAKLLDVCIKEDWNDIK